MSKVFPDGSTFRTVDEEPLVQTDDRWFRPVFAGVGPDGCVYIGDWYDTRLSHVRPVDDWHKESGRIYRVKPKGTKPKVTHGDLSKVSEKELLGKFKDPNWGVRKRALLETEWREDLKKESGNLATNFYKMLSENGRSPEAELWKLREPGSFPDSDIPKDPSLHERAYLAAAAKKGNPDNALAIVEKLLGYDEDFTDPHIPLLIWWAIEAHAEDGRRKIEALASDPGTWKSKVFREVVAERLSRRYCMAGGEANFLSAAKLLEKAPDDDARQRLMTGLQLAFQGATIPELPDALTKQMDAYAASSGGSGLALAIQRGDKDALKKALGVVASSSSNPVERVELAKLFGDVGDSVVVPTLLKLLSLDQQSTLKRVALQSLASYEDPNIPKTILARHGSTLPAEHEVRSTAHRVLAGRVDWAKQFLEKIDLAHIKARNVSTDVVQLLAQHKDPDITAAIRKHWPNSVAASSEENQKEIARIKGIVSKGDGDADAGKVHFTTRCAICHKLFGEGTTIGPDLTPYERQNLDFWTPAIVDPSLELREGFLNYVATMNDGRIIIGLLKEQTPQTVTLKDLAGQESVLDRSNLKSLEASPVSLMPPSLLAGLSDEEIRDLFAYLRKDVK